MKIRHGLIATSGILLPAAAAQAHSYIVYVSTPVSPPDGYQWVQPASLAITWVANILLIRWVLRGRWPVSVLASGGAVLLFWAAFYGFGVLASSVNTAPPPGLGPPETVYRGRDWSDVGGLFITWNLLGATALALSAGLLGTVRARPKLRTIGLLLLIAAAVGLLVLLSFSPMLLLVALLVFTVVWLIRRRSVCPVLVVLTNMALYAACLTPFLLDGALSHGWAGGYAHMSCDHNRREVIRAMLRYRADNPATQPDAQTYAEMLERVAPYIQSEWLTPEILRACPVAASFLKNPQPYTWSGTWPTRKTIERDLMHVPPDESLIGCPYGHGPPDLDPSDFTDTN